MVSSFLFKSLLIFAVFQLAPTKSGFLHIKFLYYNNSKGYDEKNESCDKAIRYLSLYKACDTFFKINFTQGNKSLKSFRTSNFDHQNSVKFGDKLSESEQNPLVMNFSTLQKPFEYRIDVWDEDPDPDDKIESFTGNLSFNRIQKWKMVNATNPGRSSFLLFNASVKCPTIRDENGFFEEIVISNKTDDEVEELKTTEKLRFSTLSSEDLTTPEAPSFPPWTIVASLFAVLLLLLICAFPISLLVVKIQMRDRGSPKSSPRPSSVGIRSDNDSQTNQRSDDLEADLETARETCQQATAPQVDSVCDHVYEVPSMEKKRSRILCQVELEQIEEEGHSSQQPDVIAEVQHSISQHSDTQNNG